MAAASLKSKLRARELFDSNSLRLERIRMSITMHMNPEPEEQPEPILPFGQWCRTFLPAYFTDSGADFHGPLFEALDKLHKNRGTKLAIVAPREGAKSTIITFAYVLKCAVEGTEPSIAILSDSSSQARELLYSIRCELEENDLLEKRYSNATGEGSVWQAAKLHLNNGCRIAAFGRGERIRGRKNRQYRPSLIIFDDVENNESVTSQNTRTKTWRWATREVIPAGEGGKTNFLSVGSALHRECVAIKLGEQAGWNGHMFQAIHSWPERMEFWIEWERIATNLAHHDRNERALAFYEKNKEEMDKAAKVYWPQRWSLYNLMARRAEIGASAFDTEYQGIPGMDGITEWPDSYFRDTSDHPLWFDEWPIHKIVFKVLALDPSKGRTDRDSDYQSHVIAALTTDGDIYIEAKMERQHPTTMVSMSLDLFLEHKPNEMVIEEDQLGLLLPEFIQQATARKIMLLPMTGYIPKQHKSTRIRGHGSYLARNGLRFRHTQGTQLLVEQMRQFPNGDHDDGPDSARTAIIKLEEFHEKVSKPGKR
jgi:predicted phage terminase large subunit-like protein